LSWKEERDGGEEAKMTGNLIELGLAIRGKRKERGLTIKELAERADVSIGLISKIENYRTVPSLPVLLSIAGALRVDLSELVANIKTNPATRHVIVRKNERVQVTRERGSGVEYASLIERDTIGAHFQSFVIRLEPDAWREKSVTDGDEFLLVLSGTLELRLGDETITLEEGDSIFFDGSIPHAPSNPTEADTEFLAVYIIKN
jgi:transcriptional regulator with XRE-family HTH domain